MALINPTQIKAAITQLTAELGRASTYHDVKEHFGLRSPQHARYYIKQAVDAGLIEIDFERKPFWLRVV
jgi:hypothetical protein